jgi:hypothetical protein
MECFHARLASGSNLSIDNKYISVGVFTTIFPVVGGITFIAIYAIPCLKNIYKLNEKIM